MIRDEAGRSIRTGSDAPRLSSDQPSRRQYGAPRGRPTQNRQNAVRSLVADVDILIVVGSQNSSNSNRLRELGERAGVDSYLVDDPAQIQESWLEGKTAVGVTAGASAPEILVERILERLAQSGVDEVREVEGELETITFKMPPELLEGAQ